VKYLLTNLALQLTDTVQTSYGVFITGKHLEQNPMFTNMYNLLAIKFLLCVVLILLYDRYKGTKGYVIAYVTIAIVYSAVVTANFLVLF